MFLGRLVVAHGFHVIRSHEVTLLCFLDDGGHVGTFVVFVVFLHGLEATAEQGLLVQGLGGLASDVGLFVESAILVEVEPLSGGTGVFLWVEVVEVKLYFVVSGGVFITGMESVFLYESGGADCATSVRSLVVPPPILTFLEFVEILLDEEHLTRSVVLPDIEDGGCLEPLNISAGL